MDYTLTGKPIDVLKKEITDMYALFMSGEMNKIEEQYAGKNDSFSRIIMIYLGKIKLSDVNTDSGVLSFYENYMSIKVIQLIHRAWQNPSQADYDHVGLEKLQVLPGVFSPNLASDSYLWAKYMVENNLIQNKDILEMGAGTGIISLYLYKYGNPKTINAVDINERAIENIRINMKNFEVDENRFHVFHSDLFQNVGDDLKCDVIFWAYVWLKIEDEEIKKIINEEKDQHIRNLLFSVSDFGYQMLDRFICESKKHLNENGKILLITSDFLPNENIKDIADKYGYSFKIEKFSSDTDVVKSANMVLDLYNITLGVK